MVIECNIPRSLAVTAHKLLVTRWSLVLGVACQHTLNAHTNTLNTLNWAPALRAEKVQAYDAVGVNMRVHWYRSIIQLDKSHLGCLYLGAGISSVPQNSGEMVTMNTPIG